MAYYDRDYSKQSYEPPNYVNVPKFSAIIWLMVICVVFSVIEYEPKLRFLTDISFDGIIRQGHIWAILFAPFAPDFFWGALGHCLLLFFIGRRLIETDGFKEFLSLYFSSALVGMILFWGVQFIFPKLEMDIVPYVDATNWSACGLFSVFAMRYSKEKVYLYFVLPIQIRLLLTFLILFLFVKMASNHIYFAEYFSLLGSIGFGYLIASKNWRVTLFGSRLKLLFGKLTLPFSGAGASLNKMTENEIKAEIDRLLDKITASGPGSLTSKERDFLMKSSKRNK